MSVRPHHVNFQTGVDRLTVLQSAMTSRFNKKTAHHADRLNKIVRPAAEVPIKKTNVTVPAAQKNLISPGLNPIACPVPFEKTVPANLKVEPSVFKEKRERSYLGRAPEISLFTRIFNLKPSA